MFVCTNPKFNYMKKVVLFIALVATTVAGAQAQKFQGGEKNLEVQFSPLSGNPIGINGLRFRMFNSESSAIRVGFSVGGSNDTEVRKQPYEIFDGGTFIKDMPELYSTSKSFNFSIRPGYEKHFAGTDRLSPYVGAELFFTMGSSSYSEEYSSAVTAADNEAEFAAKWSTWSITRSEGTTTFGLNAIAGADFYFVDNFYLGVELGLGFQNTKYKDSEIELSSNDAYKFFSSEVNQDELNSSFTEMLSVNAAGAVETNTIIGPGDGKFKSSSWGPNFQSTLRLGWLF
jgi:opacity protein-like surface antigen